MKNEYAPIILFVYNRLDHSRQVIEALERNELSKESDLFIYSDGAKNDSAVLKVEEVRKYIHGITSFKSVTIIEREYNYGLKRNILEGVSEVIEKYDKAIVMEDDILVTRFFLEYMNDALDRYENNEEVMQISASHQLMNINGLQETFLIKKGFCQGWGTWKRAWDKLDKDINARQVLSRFNLCKIWKFNLFGATDEFGEIIDNYLGLINTWAVFWDVCIFENDGLVLVPRDNLITNIGFDGSGEHSPNKAQMWNIVANKRIDFFSNVISENKVAAKRYRVGCLRRRPDIIHRMYYGIKRLWQLLCIKIKI